MTPPKTLGALAFAVTLSLAGSTAASGWNQSRPVVAPPAPSFALLGDVPYGAAEETKFDNVIAQINADRDVRFVLHNGDVKAGSERCDDAVLEKRFNHFQKFDDAFIVTPGDNDWTDCHRSNNGNYVPTERLARFREIFYPNPGMTSGGHPMRVETQADMPGYADYVENVLWRFNGTVMATVHVVGSNNNLAPWNQIDSSDSYATPRPDRIAEFEARQAAALAWIDRAFNLATQSRAAGVLLAMQANPNFDLATSHQERQGFNAILARITEHAIDFGKPVLLVHGDSHYFRMDQPLSGPRSPSGSATLENVTRLENFGSPNVHWVEVAVDPRDPNVFRVEPHIVEANKFAR